MSENFGPERWAIDVTKILNAALGPNHFPIRVAEVAYEVARNKFPDDPVAAIRGADLPGFEGALYPPPAGRRGWAILYNRAIASPGRINFTLAHEFGHYLLHRRANPKGIECSEADVVRWDSSYGQMENQANRFAANLLMPFDDYRRLIPDQSSVAMEDLSAAAERYGVSLIAAILRWMEYTCRRAILVLSRDGFILWAKSNPPAFESRAFIRTKNLTVPVPGSALASAGTAAIRENNSRDHDGGVWLAQPVRELAAASEQFDFVISLLLLESQPRFSIEQDQEEDTFARFGRAS
ncbi:MAG TPA: ImmA/IrrE family metallo-endopeptidase [Rhizomicrobium sp.]|nr:ImmA/IrrE family metallo-endopeptidase [Rhizomicrobium sp.]